MSKKILVVDDELDIQDILQAYLERADGLEVVSALSGEAAVDAYRDLADADEPPTLVVMDLNLSGSNADQEIVDAHRRGESDMMDGVRTAEAILSVNEGAVIWGYTAWSDTDWGDRLREAGAERVVDRTVPFKDFAGLVKQFLDDAS